MNNQITIYRRQHGEDLQAIVDRTKLPLPLHDGNQVFGLPMRRIGSVTRLWVRGVRGNCIVGEFELVVSMEVDENDAIQRVTIGL